MWRENAEISSRVIIIILCDPQTDDRDLAVIYLTQSCDLNCFGAAWSGNETAVPSNQLNWVAQQIVTGFWWEEQSEAAIGMEFTNWILKCRWGFINRVCGICCKHPLTDKCFQNLHTITRYGVALPIANKNFKRITTCDRIARSLFAAGEVATTSGEQLLSKVHMWWENTCRYWEKDPRDVPSIWEFGWGNYQAPTSSGYYRFRILILLGWNRSFISLLLR